MGRFDKHGLDRASRKLGGVCSNLGEAFNIDPTFLRIGFVAAAIMVSWEMALVAYVGAAIWIAAARRRAGRRFGTEQTMGRMRGSVHDLRTRLDENDRRMMAIDRHLATPNDALAREIEELREGR